jgi:hypothetical protein
MTSTMTLPILRLPKFKLPRVFTTPLSAIALFMCACIITTTVGCTAESTKQVVQDIANVLPTLRADIDIASQVAQTLDPAATLIIVPVTAAVDAGVTQLQLLCTAYAQSGDPTILASINTALNTYLNQNAAALLDAAKITDPQSRATALRIMGAIQTALQLIYGIYQKIQSKAQVKATAEMRTYKLRDIAPYLDHVEVAQQTGHSFEVAMNYEMAQGF